MHNITSGRKVKGFLYDLKRNRSLLAMVLLPIALVLVFSYATMPYGIIIAFQDYEPLRGLQKSSFVGLKNFRKFLSYYDLGLLFRNTIILNVYDLCLAWVPMFFALVLYHCPFHRLTKLLNSASLMPMYISTVILCSITQRFLRTDGMLNDIRAVFGATPTNYLVNGPLFYTVYVLSGVWSSTGQSAIIYSALLADRSNAQHRAAQLDGASLMKRIIYIDLPLMLPLFCVNLAFRAGAILANNYEKILLFMNTANQNYARVLSLYSYEVVFESIRPQYSLSAAIGILTALVNLSLFALVSWLTKRWEVHDE